MDSTVDDSMRLGTCPNCERQFKNVKLHQTKAKCSGLGLDSVSKSSAPGLAIVSNTGGEHLPNSISSGSEKRLRHKLNAHNTEIPPEIDVRSRLELPNMNDSKKWTQLDAELTRKLEPIMQHLPSTQGKGEMFEDIIYQHAADACGTVDVVVKIKPPKKKNQRQKKEIKKLKKLLKKQTKSGLANDKTRKEYQIAVRLHNKILKLERQEKQEKLRNDAMRNFRKNPYKYAQNLISKSEKSKAPTLSEIKTEKYFRSTYHDRKRHYNYHPPKGLEKPKPPKILCNLKFPSLKEVKEIIWKKPNNATPGPSGVPYIIYKKCPQVTGLLYKLLKEIWINRKIPLSWRLGETILIPKTDDQSDLSNFRPITLTNSAGKIFFTIVARKIQHFMLQNNYIKKSIQKGFQERVAGCLEHTETLTELLKDAKRSGRQIAVVWVDLANAYGSIPHNLIQFSLDHYQVPRHVNEIVFNYYDNLFTRVKTKDWTTKWIPNSIGLFQGCPLSVTLFLVVFNLCLDMVEREKKGYSMKNSRLTFSLLAYADDLTLIASNEKDCQCLLNALGKFLSWSRTMKAKPSKCKSLIINRKKPNTSKSNTKLNILNCPIPEMGSEPIRFLGKIIYRNLKDNEVRKHVREKLQEMLKLTDKDSINGPSKAWIYNNLLVQKLSWEFTVYDFPLSFAKQLEAVCTSYLKKWLDLSRNITPTALYRGKNKGGLQLIRLTTHLKCTQLVKCHLNKNSQDSKSQMLYNKQKPARQAAKNWNGTKELEERERHLILNEMSNMYCGQTNRKGLGSIKRQKRKIDMNKKEERKALTNLTKEVDEEQTLLYLYNCSKQGQFLKWDTIMDMDTLWKEQLYVINPNLLSFRINATHDVLPTPANLHLWKKTDNPICNLCSAEKGTLHHILNNCNAALEQGRYTWRHDQVLDIFAGQIETKISNPSKKIGRSLIEFVPQGAKIKNPSKERIQMGILDKADDWILLVDSVENEIIFPGIIAETSLRPDIVLWSRILCHVILIELTVPAEINFENANSRKRAKYSDLVDQCQLNGWKVHLFPIEVGSRGFAYGSVYKCAKELGFDSKTSNKIIRQMSKMALRCSYAIYLSRGKSDFQKINMTKLPLTEEKFNKGDKAPKRHPKHTNRIRHETDHPNKISNKPNKSKTNICKTDYSITKKYTNVSLNRDNDQTTNNQMGNTELEHLYENRLESSDHSVGTVIDHSISTVIDHSISTVINHQCGLYNLGNTCYINSCIQLIFHTKYEDMFSSVALENSVSWALRQLLLKMHDSNNIRPWNFIKVVGAKFPQFGNREQQDAHEFLVQLLNVLQIENDDNNITDDENIHLENVMAQKYLSETLTKNSARWNKDFLTIEQYSITCYQCHSTTTRFQSSCCLSFKVPVEPTSLAKIFIQNTDDTAIAFCESCTSLKQKKIRSEIILTSKYLLIHLDRFLSTDGVLSKNEAMVQLTPLEITINSKTLQYKVVGVIAHYGTITSGHYTYCHNNETTWTEVSDLSITPTPPPSNGYIILLELVSNLG